MADLSELVKKDFKIDETINEAVIGFGKYIFDSVIDDLDNKGLTFDELKKHPDILLQQVLTPIKRYQAVYAKFLQEHFDKLIDNLLANCPEFAVGYALIHKNDKKILDNSIKFLLECITDKDYLLIGEPSKLVLLGEDVDYREVINIEDVAPKFKNIPENMKAWSNDFWDEILTFIKNVKRNTAYKEQEEIKRQGSSWKYRHESIEDLQENKLTQFASRDKVYEPIEIKDDRANYLSRLQKRAKEKGWRQDRINSLIKVANYAWDNDLHNVALTASELNIHRDTLNERKRDLAILIGEIHKTKCKQKEVDI